MSLKFGHKVKEKIMNSKISFRQYCILGKVKYPRYLKVLGRIFQVLSILSFIYFGFFNRIKHLPLEIVCIIICFWLLYFVSLPLLACRESLRQYREYYNSEEEE